MFDSVRNNKRIVQLVLAIIILPFALWGVDSYLRGGGGTNEVARVGKVPIFQEEFQRALSEQQDRLRAQVGNNAALLESTALRRGVLQELINQRLLLLHASRAHLGVSNEALTNFITSLPALQVDGKFSRERYEALIAGQNMSVEQFEAMLRRDLLMQQVTVPIANASVMGGLAAERWLTTQLEERTVAEALISAERFAADSKPDEAAIKRYYDENRSRFERPEQVRVEYVQLDQNNLIADAKVDEAAIRAAYETNKTRYRKPEQRRASHILIRVDKDAPEAAVKQAEEQAAKVLAQVKQRPDDFAKLAQQYSQDPGSAANGGDLGFFGRGMMVKAFEEAVFALEENQISDLVRSDFGFHIIKLSDIRPEQAQNFEEVRGAILEDLKRQEGARRYAEAAEGFANLVYEQADSLKPAAEKYGLTIQTSDWLAKGGVAAAPFDNAKLREAIFTADAVKEKRNTEAIEIAPNTLVAARVVEHRPPEQIPLEQVAPAIEKFLTREAALAKAVAAGQAELDKLKRGEPDVQAWSAARTVTRLHTEELSEEARAAIFAAPTSKLPAYAGARTTSGFALYRIDKVAVFDPASGERAAAAQALRQQYGEVVAREDLLNWLTALRQQYGVTINSAALERK